MVSFLVFVLEIVRENESSRNRGKKSRASAVQEPCVPCGVHAERQSWACKRTPTLEQCGGIGLLELTAGSMCECELDFPTAATALDGSSAELAHGVDAAVVVERAGIGVPRSERRGLRNRTLFVLVAQERE